MGQMHSAVAETDAGVGRCQQNFSASLIVGRILNHPDEVFRDHFDGPGCPDVGNGVGALVSRAHFGVLGSRSLVIG